MALKVNDAVAFRWQDRWVRDGKVVGIYPQFHDAVRVEKNGLDYLLPSGDVQTMAEHEAALEQGRASQAQQEYGDLIQAWNEGKKTPAALAEATNTPPQGIHSRLRAARRRGLLL